jgi:hypothetical protein
VNDPRQALGYANYIEVIDQFEKLWKPHAGQIIVGQAYWRDQITSLFVQCGRKFGKTELSIFFLWRIAKLFPNSPCYYVAPLQKQAREIVWADPRLLTFGPREWLLPGSRGVNNSDLRLNFTNGSFIKVDGSDNYEKYRGIKYKVVVYDEYKDHRPEMRKGMRPNASVLDGLDLYIGSPPDHECDYTMLAEEHRQDKEKFFYQGPTWENPHINRMWLAKEKARLYARGEAEEWEREYAARFVKGGAAKIFIMLRESIKRPHFDVVDMIRRDLKKLQFYVWFDPAGATCFAALFLAINPYSKKIYVLDEIYETEQSEMTTQRIGKRALSIREELNHRVASWRMGYDEAATWFNNEWQDHFQDEEALEPSHKHLNDKKQGLTLIKDILLQDLLVISDRCRYFFYELDNYRKDKNGNIPKKDDHLIDCFRYILGADNYSVPETKEDLHEKDEMWRGARIEDDFPSLGENFESEEWGEFN